MQINISTDTVFFCAHDKKRLEFIRGRYSYYYRCPECQNRISVREAKKIRDDLEAEDYCNNLKEGTDGQVGNVKYIIKKITRSLIAAEVENTRVLRKQDNN